MENELNYSDKKYDFVIDRYVRDEYNSEGTKKIGTIVGLEIGKLQGKIDMMLAKKIAERNEVWLKRKDYSVGNSTPSIWIYGFWQKRDELENLSGQKLFKKKKEIEAKVIKSFEEFEKALDQITDDILEKI